MSEEKKDKVVKDKVVKKETKKEKKPSRIAKFLKDYKSEMKKVVWLSRSETIKQTGVVLVVIAVATLFLGLLDFSFTQLISLIGK